MTYDFNYYKAYVTFRVIPEQYGYTILRAALEFVEEYLEYGCSSPGTPEELEELGDICFWFAWFANVLDYDLHGDTSNFWDIDFDIIMKDMIGCIKRFYRDNNAEKLDQFKTLMGTFEIYINYSLEQQETTWDEIIASNVAKLDARFGDTFEFNTIA